MANSNVSTILVPLLEGLNRLLTDSAWSNVATLIRIGFMLGFFILLATLVLSGSREKRALFMPKRPISGLRLLLFLSILGTVLVFARQAQWQLFGLQKPEFVKFMQRYDRREFNPAHRVRPGRIVDRRGDVLAVSPVTERGVQRVYPMGPVFSHVVGYNHPLYGLSGMEDIGRSELLGGALKAGTDWKAIGTSLIDREAYTEGPALTTTLDASLQREAYQAMQGKVGAVVVMDVQTGDLRVLLSTPTFDPNRLRARTIQGSGGNAPMLNRALAGRYPPGSVLKLLVAAAAMEKGFTGTLDCPANGFTTSRANPRIRDHEFYEALEKDRSWPGHGRIGIGPALAKSSNVFFAQLGIWAGQEAIGKAWNAAGFNQSFDLGERFSSTLTLQSAKHRTLYDSKPYRIAQFSIGQDQVEVSPMHIAMLCASIARNGQGVIPRLDVRQPVRELPRLMSPEHARTLKWLMHKVVREGTGRRIKMKDLAVAGKTGTAETGGGRESHGWFAGFAPVSNPRLAFCVLVEHGGYGSSSALPVARQILERALELGEFQP